MNMCFMYPILSIVLFRMTFHHISTSLDNGIWNCVSTNCKTFFYAHKKAIIAVSVVLAVGYIRQRQARAKKLERRKKWSAMKDVVVVHAVPRGYYGPHASPYVIKLETFLRMAKIKYIFDCEEMFGSKGGKFPWITFNGQDMDDSQIIMDYLSDYFKVNINSHLSPKEKGASLALLRMTEEHIFWGVVVWRFVKFPARFKEVVNIPWYFLQILSHSYRRRSKAQGFGLHTDEQQTKMIRDDLEALSLYLGDQPYMMGDRPCELDCSIFGFVSLLLTGLPGSPFKQMICSDFKNLKEYEETMKAAFWPDWNSPKDQI